MPGEIASQITGSQRALLDRITLVNALKMPFTAMARKGTQLVDNMLDEWPVDRFEDAEDNGRVDGEDFNQFDNANKDYVVVQNRLQWTGDAAKVGKLAQVAQNRAGMKDKKARAIAKKLEKLWRNIESAFCSDNEAQVGSGSVPDKLRGLGKWIQSTAQSIYAVDSRYLTPAASIFSSALSGFTELTVQGLMTSQWTQNGEIKTYQLICGSTLKRAFTDLTNTQKGSTNVMGVLRVYNQDAEERKILNVVDSFVGDFGTYELIPSHWLAKFTSAAANIRRGYALDMEMVEVIYKQPPKVLPLQDEGGGPRFAVDAIVGLRVLNPLTMVQISSTS